MDGVIAVVHGALVIGAGVAALLALVLLIEVVAAFRNARRAPLVSSGTACHFAVIMPAHNEAQVIAATIARVLPELSPSDRLIVVADNCTDATAAVAAQAGAEVIRRDDPERRGKGYALDFAVNHLKTSPPEAIIILDADCVAAPGTLRRIAERAVRRGGPVQALYELRQPGDATSPYLRIAAFAWSVKNKLRPSGLANLGLPCQLMGTGMAFPWSVTSAMTLQTGHIVEDMVLGLELAAAGYAPEFDSEARVESWFPPSVEGQKTQRTRWETGHLSVIARIVPAYIVRGLRERNRHLVALAVDAAVPPLAFMVLVVAGIGLMTAALWVLSGLILPLSLALVATFAMAAAIVLAWLKAGKDIISIFDFARVPGYVLAKIVIYVRALSGKSLEWVRSKRD